MKKLIFFIFFIAYSFTCLSQGKPSPAVPAAHLTNEYLPYLENKRIGMVVNQTSIIHQTHLIDSLVKLNIHIVKIFAPEHGFRGTADAGEKINDSLDTRTGIPIVSLYGKNKKPAKESLQDLDLIIFDIQDVGARFYTYISTLHYVMEACAENNKELMILDRPNPNGFYVDGPVLKKEFSSFVGMHPVPIVHGMTIAEYALMINGECWLKDSVQCKLQIVKCKFYDHQRLYTLPVKPSPNLPDINSIYLYPSICLFEGTAISVGRGTMYPFRQIGAPKLEGKYSYNFTPESIQGMSKNPPYENQTCYGIDLRDYDVAQFTVQKKINLSWLIELYQQYPEKSQFFIPFFDKLAGNAELKEQIKAGKTEKQIRSTWRKDLSKFRKIRTKYLLYQ
jgi:uncharacterized protein YbbC (DUF1343 family)